MLASVLFAFYIFAMSKLETIVEELKSLPPTKLAVAAEYVHRLKESVDAAGSIVSVKEIVHRLTESTEVKRRSALNRAFGCLTESEADSMFNAIEANCERIDASQW